MYSAVVSDEDRLDRNQTRNVVRRSLEFAAPYRATVWKAIAYVTIVTLCTVAGPVLVLVATDYGLLDPNAKVLNLCVIAYLVVVGVSYIASRLQYLAINQAGEGFLRDLRVRSRWPSSTATRRECSWPA